MKVFSRGGVRVDVGDGSTTVSYELSPNVAAVVAEIRNDLPVAEYRERVREALRGARGHAERIARDRSSATGRAQMARAVFQAEVGEPDEPPTP